jgi:multiple sugar transport system permease protein
LRRPFYLLIPLAALLAGLEAYPLAYTVYLSVVDYSSKSFIGLSNYAQLFGSLQFPTAIATSLAYSSASTALTLILGVLFAFQVSRTMRGRKLVEGIYLAPLALAPIVVGVVWSPPALWDDFNGFWHGILGQPFVDVTKFGFYFPAMIVSEAYEWAPMVMLVALGVIASIPSEVTEAAEVHGGSVWQVFRRITLPALMRSPVLQFILLIRFMDAMRSFEVPFAWSTWLSLPQAGSPVDTISLLLFKLFTQPGYGFPLGVISAAAAVLVAATAAATLILYRLMTSARRQP